MPQRTYTHAQLALIARIARELADAQELQRTLGTVLDWLSAEIGLRRGVITLINEEGTEIQADITGSDIPESQSERMSYQPEEGITGRVFSSGEPVYLPRLDENQEFLDRAGLRKNLDQSRIAFFCVPITYRETVIGTLSADKDIAQITDHQAEQSFVMEVGHLLAPFVQRRRLEEQLEVFQHAREPQGLFRKLIGRSPQIEEIQRLVVKVADASTTILIGGETGTGKGVVAELIHEMSPRKDHPFLEVNCGAIPEHLVESELFGHEKGAFTGATHRRTGVLERAGAGTVFLDEIGELPLTAQTRLLRVLQSREYERVGGNETLRCAARIIAASNRDLEQAVTDGSFRSDLYYRVNVFPIHMPPLRERGKADIMLLAEHFAQRFAQDQGKHIERMDTPCIDMLTAYHWPGNVRELENVIERAVLLTDGSVLHGHDLPPSLQMNRYTEHQESHNDFNTRVRNYEIELITEALKETNGNQTKAAENLGITKRMIQYKIRNYGINYRRFRRT